MEYAGTYCAQNPSSSTYSAYLETLTDVVGWLLSRDYDVRLLIGDAGDVAVTRELKALLKSQLKGYNESRIIDEPVSSVEDLISQLAATDFVVATRFHNVVLALLNNKPVISISFHHKCDSLMRAFGLSEYCIRIESLEAQKLIQKLCELEMNAAKLKSFIRAKVRECRIALEEQYRLIFNDVMLRSTEVIMKGADVPTVSLPEGTKDLLKHPQS
jgi:polysaccharide pyruvyl transferase WcaK-like protein